MQAFEEIFCRAFETACLETGGRFREGKSWRTSAQFTPDGLLTGSQNEIDEIRER